MIKRMEGERYVTQKNENSWNYTEKQKINVTGAMNCTISKKGVGLEYGITMIDRLYD